MSDQDQLEVWRSQVDDLAATKSASHKRLQRCRQEVVAGEAYYYAAEEAQQIVQAVAELVQEQAHDRIAGVVTRCLATVFPEEPYEFQIKFERKRGSTEARLQFVRDGMAVNPIDSSGGGVVDVAAFALRVSCLMLKRPAARRVLVMDEPFRFVSARYRPAVAQMLQDLASELGIQMIMVTHIEELRVGSVLEI